MAQKNYSHSHKPINIWGLGIGDWGLGIGDWAQSPIPNPQSPIPNPQLSGGNIDKIKSIFVIKITNNTSDKKS